ncbi:Diaminopimelate decarboxylase [bacterium HR15]|nr:Diaminopimelate decarboxylase [bacterium HR15]
MAKGEGVFLLGTQSVNAQGHLEIGGCDAVSLAEQFGTPLYVLDETALRTRCREYRQAFHTLKSDVQILYAGKAALNLAICQIVAEEGLGLDVASGGELYTALQAGFPPDRIHFHGVYKTHAELQMAIDAGIHAIVLDNFAEMERLCALLSGNKRQGVMIRIAPEVEANTHPLIRTGQRDSKFGFHLLTGDAFEATRRVLQEQRLQLLGFHCHIGSQISDLNAFAAAAEVMVAFAAEVRRATGFAAACLNLGGGLSVRYTAEDQPPAIAEYAKVVVDALRAACDRYHFPEPALMVEPGRSLIAEAGCTLYRVGAIKRVPAMEPPDIYLIVDGGMSDNPRPQMYGASYTAILANRAHLPHDRLYRLLGKHCETDPIIEQAWLPEVHEGDLIAVLTTGAYAYSMSSNYNRYPRPAMVLVHQGTARLIVERERFQDVMRYDKM